MTGGHQNEHAIAQPSPTDEELLKRIAGGDGAAFGLLAERMTPRFRRVLFRLGLTEAEAEDVVQDALIKVWQGSARFEGRSAVATWACRIALNRGISVLRARRVDHGPQPMVVVDAEATWASLDRGEAVREAIMGPRSRSGR